MKHMDLDRMDLDNGGTGVVALLASPDEIVAVAYTTIRETGDLTNHAENGLSARSRAGASGNGRARPPCA